MSVLVEMTQLPEGFENPLKMVKECVECNYGEGTDYAITSMKSWGKGWKTKFEFSVVVSSNKKEYLSVQTFENGWEQHKLISK